MPAKNLSCISPEWIKEQISAEPYWFHRFNLGHGIITPGWSDPIKDKLPHFGLPSDLTGKRVLDIGCSEGFFSFEAERRGAAEVLAIDCNPATIRRFNICRAALGSRAMAVMTSIYDLSPRTFGIFDVVLFYGVLYHLRHPLLALEKVASVCGGKLLMQTANFEDEKFGDISAAKFYPRGLPSGPAEKPIFDPTVFWIPNAACIRGMLEHVGFCDIELISMAAGAVFGAQSANQTIGRPPDETTAPWS